MTQKDRIRIRNTGSDLDGFQPKTFQKIQFHTEFEYSMDIKSLYFKVRLSIDGKVELMVLASYVNKF